MNESFSPKMTSLHGTNLNTFANSVVKIFYSYIKYEAPEIYSKPALRICDAYSNTIDWRHSVPDP